MGNPAQDHSDEPATLGLRPLTTREFISDLWCNRDPEPARLARLRLGAWLRISLLLPLVYLPTAMDLNVHLNRLEMNPLQVAVTKGWYLQNTVMTLACVVLLLMGSKETPRKVRAARMLTYLMLMMEIGSNQFLNFGYGTLSSTTPLFLIVIVASYRVFFDFRFGFVAMCCSCFAFLTAVILEVQGVLAPHPFLPQMDLHPFWEDPSYYRAVLQSVLVATVVVFWITNLAVNQTNRLRIYVTHSVLQRYLPPALVERAARGELDLNRPPERRVVTVLFTDLVGFTPMSERLSPEELADVLNNHLSGVANLAHAHGATVDKFIGDAAMVVFGAPEEMEPAEQARRCAALARAIHAHVESSEATLQARTGFNTGEVILGMFGSQWRSDYTVLGSAVNVAARLESASKPGRILLGGESARLLEGVEALESAGALRLKGVTEPVRAYFLENPKT